MYWEEEEQSLKNLWDKGFNICVDGVSGRTVSPKRERMGLKKNFLKKQWPEISLTW